MSAGRTVILPLEDTHQAGGEKSALTSVFVAALNDLLWQRKTYDLRPPTVIIVRNKR